MEHDEITKSIKAMQSAKTPRPDAFPKYFLKKCSVNLAPLLLNMLNESLVQGTLPQTLTMASFTLLLKPGKDTDECGAYQPIPLLNAGNTILAKALAMRLDSYTPDNLMIKLVLYSIATHSVMYAAC